MTNPSPGCCNLGLVPHHRLPRQGSQKGSSYGTRGYIRCAEDRERSGRQRAGCYDNSSFSSSSQGLQAMDVCTHVHVDHHARICTCKYSTTPSTFEMHCGRNHGRKFPSSGHRTRRYQSTDNHINRHTSVQSLFGRWDTALASLICWAYPLWYSR